MDNTKKMIYLSLLISIMILSSVYAYGTSFSVRIMHQSGNQAAAPVYVGSFACGYANPYTAPTTFSWGTRTDCHSRCGSTGPGTYYAQAVVTSISSCPGVGSPPSAPVPVTPANLRIPTTTSNINFIASLDGSRRDTYCDCTNPTIAFTTPSVLNLWYRDGTHQINMTYYDNNRIYSARYSQRRVGVAWPAYTSVLLSGNSGTFNVPLVVSSTQCEASGSNQCELAVISRDWWDRDSSVLSGLFNIDRVAPISTFAWSRGADYAPAANINWYRNSDRPGYTVTCTDAHSGCRQINTRACLGGTTSCTLTTRLVSGSTASEFYAGTTYLATCNSQRCDRNVRYLSYDNALANPGNAETEKDSLNILLDGVAPTTTITSSVPSGGWTRTSVSATFTCSDTGGSGCKNVSYSLGTSACSSATYTTVGGSTASPTYTCTAGYCEVYACGYSTDNVGNVNTVVSSQIYYIDNTPPTISAFTLTPTVLSDYGVSGRTDYYRDQVTVTTTVQDVHSGLSTCSYRTRNAGGTWSSPISIPACASSGSTTNPLTVTFTPLLGSGQACTISGNNACEIEINVSDSVGNSANRVQPINTDFEAVTRAYTWSIANYTDPVTGNRWYNRYAPYTITSTDNLAGSRQITVLHQNSDGTLRLNVGSTNFNLVGPSQATYTNTMGLVGADVCNSQNCPVRFQYQWHDFALRTPGNTHTAEISTVVHLDSVPPTTTISSPPQGVLQPGTHWVGQNFDYTISCDDQVGSGCRDITYSCTLAGSCPSQGTEAIIPNAGSFTHLASCAEGSACLFNLTRSATDNVLHVEPQIIQLYGIDKVDPSVDGVYTFNPPLRQPGFDRWINESFTLSVIVRDDHSGIGSCSYRIRDGMTWSGPIPLGLANGCLAGNANLVGANVDDDRTRTLTFPITVGAGQQCSTEGRDECEIEIAVTDMVGRTITYSENVSIDYTAPSCDIVTIVDYAQPYDESPFAYYNHTERRFYYNSMLDNFDSHPVVADDYPGMTLPIYYNVTMIGNDTNVAEGLSGLDVSGIHTITFPDITSLGDTNTVPTSSLESTYDGTVWTTTHNYNYDNGSTQQGIFNVIVSDQAGNSNTCQIDVVNDVSAPQPPPGTTPDEVLTYDHYVTGLRSEYDLNFGTIEGMIADPGILGAYIYVYYGDGIQMVTPPNQYIPGCENWEDYTSIDPLVDDRYVARVDTAFGSWNPMINSTHAHKLNESKCHRFVLDVISLTGHISSFVNAHNHTVGVDGTPGNECTIYGRYDNCNNRSSYFFNGINTTRLNEQGECPGSCVGGTVRLLGSGGATTPYTNAEVFVESFSDTYINISDSAGQYTLYNITQNDRPHAFTANPTGIERALYLPRTQTITLSSGGIGGLYDLPTVYEPRDFTFAFDPRVCNDDCVAEGDPFQLCRSECIYNDEIGQSLCGATPLSPAEVDRVQACADVGAQKGWLIDTPSGTQQIICCGVGNDVDVLIDKVLLNGTLEVDASNVARTERVVSFRGKLVRLIVTVFR